LAFVTPEFPTRPLLFVAHPDDETLAFGGLLQRLPVSLVVIATDGASTGYGLERAFGSLKAYADLRFQEASRVFTHVPKSSFKRLIRSDGTHFNDQHLFEELPAAATSLLSIAREFAPDAIISHCYEGAHIDHDTCSFLAMHVAAAFGVKRFEFPLYWLDPRGKPVLQQFRDIGAAANAMEWQLSEAEIQCKKKMLAEYYSQRGTVSTFTPDVERMRPAPTTRASFSIAQCRSYMYQERRPRFYHTRHHRLSAKILLKNFVEFEKWHEKQSKEREEEK
jgi:N-acetylglucosamine malate deacetylase 2